MAGGDQTEDNNPKGFNECVSQEKLPVVVEDAQKRMNEAIRKAVTDALIELNIDNMERLDKRISTLTDKVTELVTLVAVNNNDVSGSNTDGLLPEDTVHDVARNMDRVAFWQERLRQRLCRNTTGMGGVHHHHRQGNNHHVPDDP